VQLQEALGPEIAKSDLINVYVKLLKDQEAEVRTAAARGVPGMLTTRPPPPRGLCCRPLALVASLPRSCPSCTLEAHARRPLVASLPRPCSCSQ
jgi:hypothetical protein